MPRLRLVGLILELGKKGERLQRRELIDVDSAQTPAQLIVRDVRRLEQSHLRLSRRPAAAQ